MAYQLPTEEKKWIQSNKSDVFGNLFATFNLNFDISKGKIRISPRLRINTDETDDAQLGLPFAFLRGNFDGTDRWWAACGDRFFNTAGTDPTGVFTEDTSVGAPNNLSLISSDAAVYNGDLIASISNDLVRKVNGSNWDTDYWTGVSPGLGQTALTASIPHPLAVTKKTNLLLVADGNLLHTVNTNANVAISRVVLPSDFQIIWMACGFEGTWIGARNTQDREAHSFFWDEVSENYNRGYGLKSDHTFCGIIKDGICHVINGSGQLLRFTGSGFDEAAVFPNFEQIDRELDDGSAIRRSIHKNGIALIEEKIHILAATQISNDAARFLLNFPSGVWTYDEDEGLRHKYSVSQYDGTEIDYGCIWLVETGAIVPTSPEQGLFLVGADVFTNATLDINAILYRDTNDSIVKRGFFISSVFESSAFEDVFQDLLLSFKRFRSSSDRIRVWYRTIKNPNFPIVHNNTGTWSDTDTFTTTANLANVAAGDAVILTRGRGAGTVLRIDSITEAAGTYTVNLDETVVNASGTIHFIVDDWTRCATISTQGIERQGFNLDAVGTFIQLLVELRSASGSADAGNSPELEKIVITNKAEIET